MRGTLLLALAVSTALVSPLAAQVQPLLTDEPATRPPLSAARRALDLQRSAAPRPGTDRDLTGPEATRLWSRVVSDGRQKAPPAASAAATPATAGAE